MKIIASSQKALISLTLGGFECCKSVTTLIYKVGNECSWFGWPDWPRNVSAQFFGRSGKVLYGAFSIVGMASQSHNVNKGIPDDRVARSKIIASEARKAVGLSRSLAIPQLRVCVYECI